MVCVYLLRLLVFGYRAHVNFSVIRLAFTANADDVLVYIPSQCFKKDICPHRRDFSIRLDYFSDRIFLGKCFLTLKLKSFSGTEISA